MLLVYCVSHQQHQLLYGYFVQPVSIKTTFHVFCDLAARPLTGGNVWQFYKLCHPIYSCQPEILALQISYTWGREGSVPQQQVSSSRQFEI